MSGNPNLDECACRGLAKAAFEDIAKRAKLSRTLLYRIFKNKEEIYQAVFADWLVSRPSAMSTRSLLLR